MTRPFVHLHLHTEFSIVDGTVRIPVLMERAAGTGMPAVALTDQGNLFGLVKFYRAAFAAGVKPLIGVDLRLYNAEEEDRPFGLVLLCQDLAGFRNLTRLVSKTFLEGQRRGVAMADPSWFTPAGTSGLIALSGGMHGDVGRALQSGHPDVAEERLQRWLSLFGDRFYIEVTRAGRTGEEHCLQESIALAARCGAAVVATNDVRFIDQDDYEAHEARVCIQQGRTLADTDRPRSYSDQQYLKSPEAMAGLFEDIPEAIDNTVEIARRCNLDLQLGESFLPAFPVPDGQTTADFLRAESKQCLDAFLAAKAASEEVVAEHAEALAAPYRERLEDELNVICDMGFPGYFLIVADFIRWAKEQDIPVGPGRGSGAGSLVAYVLGITDLDPLQYDLLFERFLNPERVSMPDFDVDFCMEGRDRVIDYVAGRYGRDRVSQIITYGTMAAKAVIRDVGRVLGHPYGFVDRIAKQVPFEVGTVSYTHLRAHET